MTKILNFLTKPKKTKSSKPRFKKLISPSNDIHNLKVNILRSVAFSFYKEQYAILMGGGLEFHHETYARKLSNRYIRKLIAQNRVDERFSNYRKQILKGELVNGKGR